MSSSAGGPGTSWPSLKELMWRPETAQRRYSWRDFDGLRKQVRDLRTELISSIKLHNESPAPASRRRLDELQKAIVETSEELMRGAYSEFRLIEKPRSVSVYDWLSRNGLPTLGRGWRVQLWYRMLAWEFRQWLEHLKDIGPGPGRARVINALMKEMPVPENDRFGDPIWDGKESGIEVTLAWRWLHLRGRYLSDREWTAVSSYLSSPSGDL